MSADLWLGVLAFPATAVAAVAAWALIRVIVTKTVDAVAEHQKPFQLISVTADHLNAPVVRLDYGDGQLKQRLVADTGKKRARGAALIASAYSMRGIYSPLGAIILVRGNKTDDGLRDHLEKAIIDHFTEKETKNEG